LVPLSPGSDTPLTVAEVGDTIYFRSFNTPSGIGTDAGKSTVADKKLTLLFVLIK